MVVPTSFAQLFKDLDQAFADLTEEGGDNA